MPDFKDMLKYFRTRENLSQSELAKHIGVSTSTISMYEAGNREPDFETEEKIADFFNTDLNTLRGRDIESRTGYSILGQEYPFDIEISKANNAPTLRHLLEYYNCLQRLNDEGKHKVFEYASDLAQNPKYTSASSDILQAAHDRTDIEVTDEMRKHDDDIMDDEHF